MIYGLVNQEQADGDRIAIANAIMKNDYHTIQQYVSQRIIIHVMSARAYDTQCVLYLLSESYRSQYSANSRTDDSQAGVAF